jgi:site-specific recombinase XerD
VAAIALTGAQALAGGTTNADRKGAAAAHGRQGDPGHRRFLHLGHFAFMRAVVQGLPANEFWDRYLGIEGERTDVRVVRATIAWIRAEFAEAARLHAKPGTARLMRLDAQRLQDDGPLLLPTLAQFAEEEGLEDESERDQVEAFQARYGAATPRVSGKARLVRRQLDALRWLEVLTARRPAGADACGLWLRRELAAFLEAAGVLTLTQLVERINGLGKGWSRSVRGIGQTKAARIARWLTEHQDSIGPQLGSHTTRARSDLKPGVLANVVVSGTDVRPLEKFIVPADLDGRQGAYRRPQAQCLLKATNDYDAILAWLRAKRGPTAAPTAAASAADLSWWQGLSHTQRSYRKEAERFLLWAIVQRHTALSSTTAEDCMAYLAFLGDPQPAARWCGVRARERWSPLWRPFEGPLGPSAQRQAVVILKNLYSFLVAQNYLMGNPWSALATPRPTSPTLGISRSLTEAQWAFVKARAATEGAHSAAIRLRLALALLYATGLRASEVVSVRVGDLQAVEYIDAAAGVAGQGGERVRGWMLRVVGKGQKLREVPVPQQLVTELQVYLASRGLSPRIDDPANAEAFILAQAADGDERAPGLHQSGRVDAMAGIAATTLYRQLKRFFARCAATLEEGGDPVGSARLLRASTHWLRHTHATHALANGVPIEVAQQNLGHVSIATTTGYVTTEQAQRMKAMARLWDAAV